MTRNQVYPSRWLKATDLPSEGEQVTIRKVITEKIGEEREEKPIISFDELGKELVVNRTRWDQIEDLTGEPDSDKWAGHVIKLVPVRVLIGAKEVETIRVEAAQPKHSRPVATGAKPARALVEQENGEEGMPY
jgi:hypothetical protein